MGASWACTGWTSRARPRPAPPGPLTINLTAAVPPPAAIPGMPPLRRADGSTLSVDSGGFALNGTRIFPVAGEMHFSRVTADAWARDLRLMRAGGLTVVSAYVIMLHHNEVEGVYDWSGARNLSAFVRAAGDAGLLVSLRIGPYAHGEVRGGGMPDWLQAVPGIALRTEQALFMSKVSAWYAAIAAQLQGAMWEQGGPVITCQLDNESADAPYLVALRAAAVAAGINPPFFTATGLNKVPFGSMLPLTGMYPVAFWDGGGNDTSSDYLFALPDFAGSGYPTLWCELGGGIAAVYCTRHRIAPMDIVASAYVAFARSSNVGYYMYHGGINPRGVLSTLQEHQAYYNGQWDLPVLEYDFVAPIGASGGVHGQYHGLRTLHLMAGDPTLGAWLAPMGTVLPDFLPSGASDGTTLRWAARTDGAGGALLIFSTSARGTPIAPPGGARLSLALPGGSALLIPHASLPPLPPLPSGAAWAWPVFPPLPGGLRLAYALAQLGGIVQRRPGGALPLVLLLATPGVAPALVFDGAGALRVLSCARATCAREGDALLVTALTPSRDVALELLAPDGATAVAFVVLDAAAGGERLWVGQLGGQRTAVVAAAADDADVLLEFGSDEGSEGVAQLRLRAVARATPRTLTLSLLPAPAALTPPSGGAPITPTPDGAFGAFSLPCPAAPPLVVTPALVYTPTAPPPLPPRGRAGHPVAPGNDGALNDAWPGAGVWRLGLSGGAGRVPPGAEALEVELSLNYTGDVARLYASPRDDAPLGDLLGDNFFNAPVTPDTLWRLGLSRALPPGAPLPAELTLRVLPLRSDADALVSLDSWPVADFGTGPGGSALVLHGVTASQVATVAFNVLT